MNTTDQLANPTANPTTMQAVVQHVYGTPDVLRVDTIAVPAIADDEVLIKVAGAALDRGTWHLVAGLPLMARLECGLRTPKRRVPGLDVSGTVVQVGAKVTGFAIGDEVCGIGSGSAAEYAPALARKIVHRPANLDSVSAATLAVSGITALRALRDVGRLQAGHRVLVYGASGGVGTFAVQIAASLGAHVTGVCSSAKADIVRALGADVVLPYDGPDAVDALDGSVRYDIIVDIAGNRPLRHARRALAPRGTLVFVGVETDGRLTGGFVSRLLRVAGWSIISRRRFRPVMPTERGEDIATVVQLAAQGVITPQIDRTIGLTEVSTALHDLAAGRIRGKVAVRVG